MRILSRLLPLAVLALVAFAAPAGAQGFQVIAHPDAGVSELSTKDLEKLFLKKTKKLGDVSAKPVDQAKGSAVRAAFSKAALGRDVAAVETYWQQQVFSGKNVPPTTKGGDAEVLAYVQSTPGAIGYVSAGAATSGVTVITVK
jgi:ABC-type phosphate transport system substrate-binding protein